MKRKANVFIFAVLIVAAIYVGTNIFIYRTTNIPDTFALSDHQYRILEETNNEGNRISSVAYEKNGDEVTSIIVKCAAKTKPFHKDKKIEFFYDSNLFVMKSFRNEISRVTLLNKKVVQSNSNPASSGFGVVGWFSDTRNIYGTMICDTEIILEPRERMDVGDLENKSPQFYFDY